jgi:hypothetical protein
MYEMFSLTGVQMSMPKKENSGNAIAKSTDEWRFSSTFLFFLFPFADITPD